MADTRTISQLEAEGYPWIGCECCKGTVWVPTTAKTPGIGIPQTLLTAADEVVDQVCLTSVTGTFESCRRTLGMSAYRVKLGHVFSSPYHHSIRSSLRFFVTSIAIFGSLIRFLP